MIDRKYKMMFADTAIQDSVAYTLVSRFNIEPSILRAEIEGSGGILILRMKGEEENVQKAIDFFRSEDIGIEELGNHISRDDDRCYHCGSCVSVCPTKSFYIDPDTFEVKLKTDTCVACGACITACTTNAIRLSL